MSGQGRTSTASEHQTISGQGQRLSYEQQIMSGQGLKSAEQQDQYYAERSLVMGSLPDSAFVQISSPQKHQQLLHSLQVDALENTQCAEDDTTRLSKRVRRLPGSLILL